MRSPFALPSLKAGPKPLRGKPRETGLEGTISVLMMNLIATLASGRTLLMDGAMGTELLKTVPNEAGTQTDCLAQWNVTHPDRVVAVHRDFVNAGARLLLTNTFQANPHLLKRYHLFDQGAEISRSAIALARSALDDGWVVGDIGPMPENPGDPAFTCRQSLLQTAHWLGDADAILLETCSDWSAWQALAWLREGLPEMPVLVSFSFTRDKAGRPRTWDGHSPEEVARAANSHQPAGLGVNCGLEQGAPEIKETLRQYRRATPLPLFARPNAGTPVQRDGQWIYPLGPAAFAALAVELRQLGVTMFGGCCGTSPAHLAAMRLALGI